MDMAADQGTVTDGVRNPMCGETPKPRDLLLGEPGHLHLHGGITPWISDGTPHQWITPAGEDTAYPKGVSVSNVPDMPDPGPRRETFFYTNQQSARLMFYHDHAWGITRLNVYAGEAAAVPDHRRDGAEPVRPAGARSRTSASAPRWSSRTRPSCRARPRGPRDPTWDSRQLGRRGQPVDAARLHAGAEPG